MAYKLTKKGFMNKIILSLIFIAFAHMAFAQDKNIATQKTSQIILTPFHAPFGILKEVPSYHVTIGYERSISNDGMWSLILPLTIGSANTIFVSDYYRNGYNVYLSPGIGYVPKKHIHTQRYQLSGHVLFGHSNYDLKTDIINGEYKNYYTGFLINNHFNAIISKKLLITFTGGLGYKMEQSKSNTRRFDNNEPYIHQQEINSNPILNLSIGFKYKL